jgi:hypothetical protein
MITNQFTSSTDMSAEKCLARAIANIILLPVLRRSLLLTIIANFQRFLWRTWKRDNCHSIALNNYQIPFIFSVKAFKKIYTFTKIKLKFILVAFDKFLSLSLLETYE